MKKQRTVWVVVVTTPLSPFTPPEALVYKCESDARKVAQNIQDRSSLGGVVLLTHVVKQDLYPSPKERAHERALKSPEGPLPSPSR